MVKEGKIIRVLEKTERTVPVYLNASPSPSHSQAWLLCHGYGQRADHLLSKWSDFDSSKYSLLAAEAPHRFYWEGVTGRPVASWMTSRLRLEDIRDNNDYLDMLWFKYFRTSKTNSIFGFSQGGTTLWRWLHDRRPAFDVFINYAGWIPEDLDLTVLQDYLQGKTLVFVYGGKDQYLTPDRLLKLKEIIGKSGLQVHIETFDGGHRIDRELLKSLVAKYCS